MHRSFLLTSPLGQQQQTGDFVKMHSLPLAEFGCASSILIYELRLFPIPCILKPHVVWYLLCDRTESQVNYIRKL